MSKKNLLIAMALTAFVLVVLANVSAVYARIRNTATLQPAAQQAAVVAEALPAQAQTVQVTHQEAANIAANFLGQNDLYSVEIAAWNGVDAYKVVFSSGTIVYISMDGQVLGSEAPQPVLVSAPARNNHDQGRSENDHSHDEDGDDHEEHEDDGD